MIQQATPRHPPAPQSRRWISDVTRLGTTGGVSYAMLLDAIAFEEVYEPVYDADAEAELSAGDQAGRTAILGWNA